MNRSLRRRHRHHQQAARLKGSQLLPQTDTNIKHIIIQWIIRCNQSVLKHHKSKPAEPSKRQPRQRSVQYPFSPLPRSHSALSTLSYRVICSYRYNSLASCCGFVSTCNTLDSCQVYSKRNFWTAPSLPATTRTALASKAFLAFSSSFKTHLAKTQLLNYPQTTRRSFQRA